MVMLLKEFSEAARVILFILLVVMREIFLGMCLILFVCVFWELYLFLGLSALRISLLLIFPQTHSTTKGFDVSGSFVEPSCGLSVCYLLVGFHHVLDVLLSWLSNGC